MLVIGDHTVMYKPSEYLRALQATSPPPARPTPAAHRRPCAQGEEALQARTPPQPARPEPTAAAFAARGLPAIRAELEQVADANRQHNCVWRRLA